MKTLLSIAIVLVFSGVAHAGLEREPLGHGLAHYQLDVPIGADTLRLHRVVREHRPWLPRSSAAAIVLLHGDFAGFESNFLPAGAGLAGFLAARGVDVWGVDRRWVHAGPDDDLAAMGFAQARADTQLAVALVRLLRARPEKVVLGGFSRGGLLAYAVASEDRFHQLRGLVPIDVYATLAPEDEDFRQAACTRAAQAVGEVSDNQFFIDLGQLALVAPGEPSPIFDGLDNLGAMLAFLAQTYVFFAPAPFYHLALPGESDEALLAGWLADAPSRQAMAEIRDGEQLWCDGSLDLAAIRVPAFYLGAGGGFGELGLHSLSLLSGPSESLIVSNGDERVNDVGHADLLFAREEAWAPLATWILGVR